MKTHKKRTRSRQFIEEATRPATVAAVEALLEQVGEERSRIAIGRAIRRL